MSVDGVCCTATRTWQWVTIAAAGLVLAACGGGDSYETPDTQAAGANTASMSAGSSADRIDATVSSAPFAGAHTLQGDMSCNSTAGIWNAMHEAQKDSGLSAVLLMVQGVPVSGGSSDNLSMSLTFGTVVMDEANPNAGMIDLAGASMGGSATATITRQGDAATIRVEGRTLAGAAVAATVHCATVEIIE